MNDEIREILNKLKSNNYPLGIATIDINKLLDYITNLQQENEDYKSRIEKAVELLKSKKEKYKNMTDYHQYYVEGYDKAIELTHSSHSGIMLETIKSTTIKNCDDLLNILQNGIDDNGYDDAYYDRVYVREIEEIIENELKKEKDI